MASLEEQFIKLVRERQTEIKDSLVQTPQSTLEKYHQQVGLHNGLEEALKLYLGLLSPENDD